MKDVAFKAPKQLRLTMIAKTREPMGPKTLDPNMTATVLLDLIAEIGSTKKYAMFAKM